MTEGHDTGAEEHTRVDIGGGRVLDRRRLLAVPVIDLPLLALPNLPLVKPLTADEVAQVQGWLRDVERIITQIAAEWAPEVRAFVDELVDAGVIPPAPPDGETPAQRLIRERRTRTHGPARPIRAPRCLPIGGHR